MTAPQHVSVMLDEAVRWWGCLDRSAGTATSHAEAFVDGTFGRGGHSRALLVHLDAEARLLGIDKDPEAIAAAHVLAEQDHRFCIARGSFADLDEHCAAAGLDQIDGILLDLGVSSPQLDDAGRGFSFMHDGPLDMRMDPETGRSAADWINTAPEAELADVFFHFGEERFSRRMARAIVTRRQERPFERTLDLAEVVKAANPRWEKHKHPATRVFQATRIFINGELDDLERGLKAAVARLRPGGRLVVISFHSLEDRMVKRLFRAVSEGERDFFGHRMPAGARDLTRKPITPAPVEAAINPRARSAKMRVIEKLDAGQIVKDGDGAIQ